MNPDDVEVLFQTALMHAGCGSLSEAIDCLEGIPEDHPEAGIPALGQSADWCLKLNDFDGAIDRYERILAIDSRLTRARRQLAYLLNQGTASRGSSPCARALSTGRCATG